MQNRFLLLAAAAMIPLLGGCATGVHAPALPSAIAAPPATWSAAGAVSEGAVRLDWWKTVGDAQLDSLVARALENNADIRAAAANLAASEALLREARAASLPSGSISGGIERNRTPGAALQLDTVGGPAVLPSQTLADIGAGLSWELDLAGRIASGQKAAAADRTAALWAKRSAEAAVVAGAVRAWFELGLAREQQALLASRIAALRDACAGLDRAVALGGVRADRRDAMLGELRALEAAQPSLSASERNAARRIATLTGVAAPDGVRMADTFHPGRMPVPEYVTAPSPGDLLRLRPDVAQAEQALLKASAGIGIAKSELYPRINFGGSVGLTAAPSHLGSAGAFRFGIGPSVSWGIFDFARIRARIGAAGAQANAAAAKWESTYLKAIEETDAALDQLAAARDAWSRSRDASQLADREQTRSAQRLAQGQDSRIAHSAIADKALAARLRETDARTAALLAWVNVQVAFGAGWRLHDGKASPAQH